MGRIVLDLCAGTGAWSQPYVDAGYDVRRVTWPEMDVRSYYPPAGVWGILAAPPCTEFAGSGARWWASKPAGRLDEAVRVVTACLRIIHEADPRWWRLENPVGRLRRWLGPAVMTYQPWEYGDPEQKRTCLWGQFNLPTKTPVPPPYVQRVWRMGPSPDRADLRSVTPAGFARAFFEANR